MDADADADDDPDLNGKSAFIIILCGRILVILLNYHNCLRIIAMYYL